MQLQKSNTRHLFPKALLDGFRTIKSKANRVMRVPQELLDLFSTNPDKHHIGCDPKRSGTLTSPKGNTVAVYYRRHAVSRIMTAPNESKVLS